MLQVFLGFDVIEENFRNITVKHHGHHMRVQDLEGPADPFLVFLGMVGDFLRGEDDLHLVDVLSGDINSGFLGAPGNMDVFLVGVSLEFLDVVRVASIVVDHLLVLVFELSVAADEQVILKVVHFMKVTVRLILGRVEVRDDVPELNDVQHREGELRCQESKTTINSNRSMFLRI
jgi:hypothetical protein